MNLRTPSRAIALLMAFAPLAFGQQAAEKELPRTSPQQSNQSASKMDKDEILAGCLIIDSQVEVAIAELAHSRAESQEVKQFAQQMIEDHNKIINSLEKFAPNAAQRLQLNGGRTGRIGETRVADQPKGRNTASDNQPESSRENRDRATAAREDRATSGQPDMLAIKTEIAEKCVQSVSKLLQEKQGQKFDQCYMAQQFFAHVQMVDMLTVVKNHVSGELQQTLAQGLQTVEQHKDHAERILTQLDKTSLAQAKRDTGVQK